MKPLTIKWSCITYYLQSAFIGFMLGFCHISISDWQFWAILTGNAVLTLIYGGVEISECKKEKK